MAKTIASGRRRNDALQTPTYGTPKHSLYVVRVKGIVERTMENTKEGRNGQKGGTLVLVSTGVP